MSEKRFFETVKDGNREKRKKIRTRRLWLDRLCINRRATRRKNKQSNVNETLNEGCLAMGEKISEFQVGIEPTSSGDAAGILQPWSFKNSFNDIIHSRIHSTPCYLSWERNCLQSKHIARNKKKQNKTTVFFFPPSECSRDPSLFSGCYISSSNQ